MRTLRKFLTCRAKSTLKILADFLQKVAKNMEKFIISNGCALRIADSRKGEKTILLLHGYLESLDVWEDFAKLLSNDYRVVAMDLPGHGISQVMGEKHSMSFLADTVVGVLDELEIEKATIVGHSMGGYVALETLRRHAERMEGIVLLSSTPNTDSPEKLLDRDREIAMVEGGHKDLLATTAAKNGFASDNLKRMQEEIIFLEEQVLVTEPEGVVALLRGMKEREDSNELLQKSSVPQLFILGKKDSYIPLDKAEAMVAAHPQAKVVWLENSGHLGYFEEPEACAEAIRAFMQ